MSPIPAGETVLLSTGPSPWLIILSSWRTLVVAAAVSIGGLILGRMCGSPALGQWIYWGAIVFALLRLIWALLDWGCREYVLTERRVLRVRGVLSRHTADLPLRRLQNLTLDRSLAERLLGVGTIGFATAGTAWIEAHWVAVTDGEAKLETIRKAMLTAPSTLSPQDRPVVIGLSGGIGSGKSRVAAEFQRLGAVVIDSDAEAKGALDRPDVRAQLVHWWGPRVIGPEGRIDRKAVAVIIFNDPVQRRRLEALVHPIVRTTRAAAIAAARTAKAQAVVIDAPLLFEAGVDAECDTVIFVDAPRPLRLARVEQTRGWDEAEFARRESQQMEPAEKRRRSQFVIANTGSLKDLAAEAEQVYRMAVASVRGQPSPATGVTG